MNAFVAAVLMMTSSVKDQQTQNPAINLEGNWTVVCLEKNGQPIQEAKNTEVTAKNNEITFTDKVHNQIKTLRLEFGDKGTLRVTEVGVTTPEQNRKPQGAQNQQTPNAEGMNQKAKEGVYVYGHDFLAICVHGEKETGAQKASETATDETHKQGAKPHIVVLLKREGAQNQQTR